jgi:hypothetical protein
MRFRVKNNGTSRQQGFDFDFDVDKVIMNKELYSLILMFVAGVFGSRLCPLASYFYW